MLGFSVDGKLGSTFLFLYQIVVKTVGIYKQLFINCHGVLHKPIDISITMPLFKELNILSCSNEVARIHFGMKNEKIIIIITSSPM